MPISPRKGCSARQLKFNLPCILEWNWNLWDDTWKSSTRNHARGLFFYKMLRTSWFPLIINFQKIGDSSTPFSPDLYLPLGQQNLRQHTTTAVHTYQLTWLSFTSLHPCKSAGQCKVSEPLLRVSSPTQEAQVWCTQGACSGRPNSWLHVGQSPQWYTGAM